MRPGHAHCKYSSSNLDMLGRAIAKRKARVGATQVFPYHLGCTAAQARRKMPMTVPGTARLWGALNAATSERLPLRQITRFSLHATARVSSHRAAHGTRDLRRTKARTKCPAKSTEHRFAVMGYPIGSSSSSQCLPFTACWAAVDAPPIIHSLQKDADHVAIDARAGSLDPQGGNVRWHRKAGLCRWLSHSSLARVPYCRGTRIGQIAGVGHSMHPNPVGS